MMRVLNAGRLADLVGDFDRDPAYRGLAEALRVLVTDGRIPVGVRLPSERELTDALGVSRTTVTRAYAELRDRGYLVSRRGSGSVAALPQGQSRLTDHRLSPDSRPGSLDLSCAAPLPGPGMLAAYERALARMPEYLAGSGYFPSGLPELREQIAARYAAEGLPTDPDQVLVVPGALVGVAIAARTFGRPGDRALLESPTYPNAIATLRDAGMRIVGAERSRTDPDVSDLASTAAQVRARIAYLVPDFHNPTGHLMTEDQRAALGRALRRAGTRPVADESMRWLALDEAPMPRPFAAHHPGTVTVGSLSKPFWGGLRVGWVRCPAGTVEDLLATRLALDLGTPPLEQLVAVELLRDGEAQVAHRRRQLRSSRDAAVAALGELLPDWCVRVPAGGLSLWCELPRPSATALAQKALERDVTLVAGPSFAPEGGLDRFLRIPFVQPAEVLREAIGRIAEAWQETGQRRPGRSAPASNPMLVA